MDKESFVHQEIGDSPVVLSIPHSGKNISLRLPDAVLGNVRLGSAAVRKTIKMGVDSAVPEMTNFYDQTDYSRVWTDIPRTILDVNRGKNEINQEAIEGGANSGDAHGLIWTRTIDAGEGETEPMLVRPYTQEELQQLLAVGYDPYVAVVKKSMQLAIKQHGFAIMLDLHTLPAATTRKDPKNGAYILGKPAPRGPDIRSGELPDLILICNPDAQKTPRSCHPAIKAIVEETARRAGLLVLTGFGPFQGDNGSTVLYSEPDADGRQRRHVVGLELVSHKLEQKRIEGNLDVHPIRALELSVQFYKPLFRALAGMSKRDLDLL